MRNSNQNAAAVRQGGFSIVEAISAVALVAIIAAGAIITGSKVMEASKATKLESDVSTINSAVKIYLSSGGNLDGVSTPEDVLDALKTTRSATEARRFAGAPASSMIDRRVTTLMQDSDEAASGVARAYWDAGKKRFFIATSGLPGVKEFTLNENWAERSIPVEKREGSTMAFAGDSDSTWIWESGNWVARRGDLGPTRVDTNPTITAETATVDPDPGDSDPGGSDDEEDDEEEESGGGGDPDPDPPPPPPRLPMPYFNPPPGAYPASQFPLAVTIHGAAEPAYGTLNFRVGTSTSFSPYSTPVPVPAGEYLYAVNLTLDPEAYRDSYTRYGRYFSLVESFDGTLEGVWKDPSGGANLVAEITNGEDSSEFAHGDTQLDLGGEILDAGVQNRLDFIPATVSGVAPGEQFELATLNMHNGTTFNDSEASAVTLEISVDLGPEAGAHVFSIPMAMENTENSDDREASADIVELLSTTTSVRPEINGVRYELRLSIAIVDDNGVTEGSKFLIYEGATATGKILGTFVPSY